MWARYLHWWSLSSFSLDGCYVHGYFSVRKSQTETGVYNAALRAIMALH